MKIRRKMVVYGCTHEPLIDKDAEEWLLKTISNEEPDVIVHAGDLFEAQAASRWPKEYPFSLNDEYVAGDRHLAGVRNAYPRAERYLLKGNHDANLEDASRISGDLLDLTKPEESRVRELANWKIVPDYEFDLSRRKGCLQLGDITIVHGYKHGVNSDEHQAIQYANPYGLFLSAHTHRPVEITQAMRTKGITLPYWYGNVGCMRNLHPGYVKTKDNSGWGHALAVVEYEPWPDKSCKYSREINGLRKHKTWDAEIRILRRAA